mgnify:FL=1
MGLLPCISRGVILDERCKEQKQNDNGEIIEMKQGQVIKIPKNSGKAC